MAIPSFTWINLFMAALVLLLFYGLLKLISSILSRQKLKEDWLHQLRDGIQSLLKIYEVIVILILSSVFIFINPVIHGLILGAVVLFSLSHIRNFVSGRLAQTDENLSIGERIRIGDAKGVIVKMGHLGLQLRTATGLRFVNYTKLFSEGYNLIALEEVGGFYEFEIKPAQVGTKVNHVQQLLDAFLMTPYIDPNRQPELLYTDNESKTLEARILIREDSHLDDLVQLIHSWGYHCQVKVEE